MSTTISPQTPQEHSTKPSQRRGSRRTQKQPQRGVLFIVAALVLVLLVLVIVKLAGGEREEPRVIEDPNIAAIAAIQIPDWIDRQILPMKSDSRRGELLEDLNDIVIHYVGNPGSTAQQNRDFYGNRGTEVNSHFLIGLEGEIIQCLPLEEKSSATSHRNLDTISIEVCHPDQGGQFTDASYEALIQLLAWLCEETGLNEEAIIRHYDVTGKECPIYYVNHEEAWTQLLLDVEIALLLEQERT